MRLRLGDVVAVPGPRGAGVLLSQCHWRPVPAHLRGSGRRRQALGRGHRPRSRSVPGATLPACSLGVASGLRGFLGGGQAPNKGTASGPRVCRFPAQPPRCRNVCALNPRPRKPKHSKDRAPCRLSRSRWRRNFYRCRRRICGWLRLVAAAQPSEGSSRNGDTYSQAQQQLLRRQGMGATARERNDTS